jgi:hypothetical protein
MEHAEKTPKRTGIIKKRPDPEITTNLSLKKLGHSSRELN